MLVRRCCLVDDDESALRSKAFGNGKDENTAAPSRKYSLASMRCLLPTLKTPATSRLSSWTHRDAKSRQGAKRPQLGRAGAVGMPPTRAQTGDETADVEKSTHHVVDGISAICARAESATEQRQSLARQLAASRIRVRCHAADRASQAARGDYRSRVEPMVDVDSMDPVRTSVRTAMPAPPGRRRRESDQNPTGCGQNAPDPVNHTSRQPLWRAVLGVYPLPPANTMQSLDI